MVLATLVVGNELLILSGVGVVGWFKQICDFIGSKLTLALTVCHRYGHETHYSGGFCRT
jgi:hypothetical protein